MEETVAIRAPLPHQLDEASRVILNAFHREAITTSFMDLSREKTRESYFHVTRFKMGFYHRAGQPLLAALCGGRIVGMAMLNSPRLFISRWRMYLEALPTLPRMLGLLPYSLRAARLGRYLKLPPDLPEEYYILEILAVARSHQGQGVGRLLLEHAGGLCNADKGASGIYLLTGEEKNRAFYEKFGYRLWETRPAGTFTAYHMFKARTSPHPGTF